ncbi:MAG TPA: VWA domain-containing protein, partial [Steroidobacteraceae bacterium]|nr:VWA domain-containing protein [Steroidobacteraceae bacterium]
ERDFVAIGDASQRYITYVYTRTGKSPATLVAPDKPGAYELRYFLGNGEKVIATRAITVGSVSASVSAPAQVAAGATFPIQWKGPNTPRDFITLVKAGTPEKQYDAYAYTSKGSPLELRAPDQAGDYEVRYLTAQSYATLGSAKITVTPINGSIQGPAEAVAGNTFPVSWKGPNNLHDYITLVPKGAREGESGNYGYTERGNPVSLLAPIAPGEYELRYATGQSHATLARAAIRITPGKQEPGLVSVTAASALSSGSGVEVILDASGSMLQRIGTQRRIDIARQTLTRLTSATIPAGTPFALRVFGREVDSCQTDLVIPLGPLNATAVGAKIATLESKNNARTPIGASLAKIAEDLHGVTGERLVILLTDGEETCGGDAAAEIDKLKKAGVGVRVNIVGFAIDDAKLAATFRHWADTSGGTYFDTQDAAGLDKALSQAMRPGFEVVDAQGHVTSAGLAGGDPVRVMPGNYTVRLKGQKGESQPAVVRAKETASVRF